MPPKDDQEQCKQMVIAICVRLGFVVDIAFGMKPSRPVLTVAERTLIAGKIAELGSKKGLSAKIVSAAIHEILAGRVPDSYHKDEYTRFKRLIEDGKIKQGDLIAKICEGAWRTSPDEAEMMAQNIQAPSPTSAAGDSLEGPDPFAYDPSTEDGFLDEESVEEVLADDPSPSTPAQQTTTPVQQQPAQVNPFNPPAASAPSPPPIPFAKPASVPPKLPSAPYAPSPPPYSPRGPQPEMRRLPVYLLLDCSALMAGPRIEAVKRGVLYMSAELRTNPAAWEMACLSVISFDSQARQLRPLTALNFFLPPDLSAGGATAFGSALQLLEQSIEKEVRKPTATQRGDCKPLVFPILCGKPTDEWISAANRIKQRASANIIACVADPGDVGMIKQLTNTVLVMRDLTPDSFWQYMKWVSSAIQMTSQSIKQSPEGTPVGLPALPPKIQMVL